jgi:hypothetical protein
MSKYYSIKHVNGITRIQFTKNPTYEEVQAVIDDIAENFPYIKRLWDFSNINFDLSIDEIKAIALYGKSKFINPNKLAIVAPDDRAYFKLHIFQAHRKQKKHSVANVFRTEQEALEWLGQ